MFAPAMVAIGVPVLWRPARATATFSFHYDGDRREMDVLAIGRASCRERVYGTV